MTTYHDRLRLARLRKQLSQAQLAIRIGVSVTTISNVERGTRDLTAPKLFAWVRACGAALDWVADGPDERPAPDPDLPLLELERELLGAVL